MLEDQNFLAAFHAVAGDDAFRQASDAAAGRQLALRSRPCRSACTGMFVAQGEHQGSQPFAVTWFINPGQNFLDVCWEQPEPPLSDPAMGNATAGELAANTTAKPHATAQPHASAPVLATAPAAATASRLFFHNATSLPIQPGDCDRLDYAMLTSPDYPLLLAAQRDRLVGTWKGAAGGEAGNATLERVDVSLRFYRNGVSALRFKEKTQLKLVDGATFKSGKNTAENEVEGEVILEYGLVRLEEKIASNRVLHKVLTTRTLNMDGEFEQLHWTMGTDSGVKTALTRQ